ncbi:hypothetical protein J7J08_10250 [Stenotrophomonas sp. ISL-67]|uniref:hypothetical protein n=1 Tax=Stenotrophomonas sp. ISL-67 TaxID=2819171 RepID=UPI001BED2955|nr:hypothetical protein [Stenotrophomonas sp. ISL-67]MBT2768016.1 hypothetical protein [Stenotrophomonas sp. ISL-67]
MHFPNLFTAVVGAAAAFHGTRAAPIASSQSGVVPLTDVCNGGSPLPDALLASVGRNYAACHRRIGENPRLFGGLTAMGAQALCVAQSGLDAGFGHALQGRPSEIPVLREGLHRLAGSRAANPLPSPGTASHSLDQLRQINFNDYRHSRSTQYASQLERQVALLRTHIPPAQRSSISDARRAAASPECRRAWKRHLPQWVRAEIAERSTLVTMREVGNPESISHAQADALRADLAGMRFGNTAMKRRMHEEAVVALVGRD